MASNASILERAIKAKGVEAVMASLTMKERELLLEGHAWPVLARPNQLPPPGDWLTWLLLGGRGAGKTRAGAEFVLTEIEANRAKRIGLIERTPADARDIMVEGESGILACSKRDNYPLYEPSKRRLTWPNGAIATIFTSYEPDMLRGPQHDLIWAEELCSWRNPRETWDNAMLGLRIGKHPRCVVTTTPRPISLLKDIIAAPTTVISRSTTFDNLRNLSPNFQSQIVARYHGTRLGRQELEAEILEDMPGALWERGWITLKPAPHLVRVVVGVDPASTSGENSDETGIVVAGKGDDGFYYTLADRSIRASPDTWARRAIQAYHEFKADHIIAETNQGGEMVKLTLNTVDNIVPVKTVHASRGKQARAEPISALYQQGRVFHTASFRELEDQLCTWVPENGESPDRLDALVWAMTELSGGIERRVLWV